MYLLTDIVPRQVDNGAEALQHVKNHLPVTALSKGGQKTYKKCQIIVFSIW